MASHWKPSTLLTENRTHRESVHVCVLCGRGAVSVASRHWSEWAARCKPRDKRTEVLHAFANGCSALFKNPFTVSWRLTQSPSSQPCTPLTNQPAQWECDAHSLTKSQGSLEYSHVWNPWYVHIQRWRDRDHTWHDLHEFHSQAETVMLMRGFPSRHSVSASGSE